MNRIETADRPQQGRVYSLSAMMSKGARWEDAEIKPSGLPLGMVVSYGDMANPRQRAVVIEDHGNEHGQQCVFLDDGSRSQVSRQALDGPGGWQDEHQTMSLAEMGAAVMFASKRRVELEHERACRLAQAATAKAAEKHRIEAAHPWLERRDASKKSDHALAAANLRRELSRAFPGVKFSVTSNSYSMGDSVTASWTDGPVQEEVEKMCRKYQDHYFDGMDDSTHYTPNAWTETFGNTKYCHASRHESQALIQRASEKLGWGLLEFDQWGSITNMDHEKARTVYREARTMVG